MPHQQPLVDYYATLGVARSATAEDILKSYRRLALVLHPDLGAGADEKNDSVTFEMVNQAYFVLSDTARRQGYDKALEDQERRLEHSTARLKQMDPKRQQVEAQVEQVVNIMQLNIEKVMQRSGRVPLNMDTLVQRSGSVPDDMDALVQHSAHFKKAAHRVQRRSCPCSNPTTTGSSAASGKAVQFAVQSYAGVNPLALHMFDEVFEPLIAAELETMAKETGVPVTPADGGSTWAIVGSLSGSIVGFMVASVPGAAFGALAGFKVGLVRDRTGVPVMEAFRRMSSEQRQALLMRVATKVLG